MKCPSCNKNISVFNVTKTFKCKSCGQSLKATNNKVAITLFFATWICISGSAYLSDVDSAVFIDVFIAPLVAFVLYFLVINIDVENEE
jgi:hypothetical protein